MKKIGLIVLAVVLAIGAMGAAYAAWSETLTINGTITAGNLDVDFVAASNDPGITLDPLTGAWSVLAWTPATDSGKNVASTEVDQTGITDAGDTVTSNTLGITVANAYPQYTSQVRVAITNAGSIPVKVTMPAAWTQTSVADMNDIDLSYNFNGWNPNLGLAPGATEYVDIILVCSDATTKESTVYSGTIKITFSQYNQ
jgi:predicted ribosomally synthesized peptide with SipW-like signal peptide